MSSPTFADLGERIGSMLGLADEEAAAIRSAAADQGGVLVGGVAGLLHLGGGRRADRGCLLVGQAEQRADIVRAEAQAAVERARAEVHTLATRRDAITAQLGNLSGVIDALAVPEQPSTTESPSTPDQEFS